MKIDKSQKFGFVRVAAVSPEVIVGSSEKTLKNIVAAAEAYAKKGARLIVFPELCLAGGYTNADLFHQSIVQTKSAEALKKLVKHSASIDAVLVVGLPFQVNSTLFNMAAVINKGTLVGLVPKTYLPSSGEFYEARWFGNADDLTLNEVDFFGAKVPVGIDLLFCSKEEKNVILGVEICEDLWTSIPPSSVLALAGATIMVNISASNELVGKAGYRRSLVTQQSGRCLSGYVYSSSGLGESTTDIVFSGHCMIAENGRLLQESKRFHDGETGIFADIDVDACMVDRIKTSSFAKSSRELSCRPPFRRIMVSLSAEVPKKLLRPNPGSPFVPTDTDIQKDVCEDIFHIQSRGLMQRMRRSKTKNIVLGLSGGLDSTLALLVCLETFKRLKYDSKGIHVYTMPGFGTSKKTKSNAFALAKAAGIKMEEIPITKGVGGVLGDIGHDGATEDITFENAQARYRTLILMQKANQLGGLVIGTEDLSEIAIGWSTYNGDHMSHYNVNCGVPKTLMQFVIKWVANNTSTDAMKKVLSAVLATPISPELTSTKKGAIAQKTEDIIGPYALHDFFLYHFVRRGSGPKKIHYLAVQAFDDVYSPVEIKKWLAVFIERFFKNQFKRSAFPDGPKVGSVALSPRGDLRMPSDALPDQWLGELNEL